MSPTSASDVGRYRAGGRSFQFRATDDPTVDDPAVAALAARGTVVPLSHRLDWARARNTEAFSLSAYDSDSGEAACTLVVEVGASRAIPGHVLWRIDAFGGYEDVDALDASLEALRDLSLERPGVLRVSVGLFGRDAASRARLAGRCSELGMEPRHPPRSYQRTLSINVTEPEDAVLAQMRPVGRRHIRAVAKHPIEVRLVSDPGMGSRVDELLGETMSRTDGPYRAMEWAARIDYANRNPEFARLVGMFATEPGEEALLAFALGLREGDAVLYSTAASTRSGPKAPLGYALAWDLMRWAGDTGAEWFDFGGIPIEGEADPAVAGIARFKRCFGGTEVDVREEWTFEPRPLIGRVSRGISAGVRLVRRARKGS